MIEGEGWQVEGDDRSGDGKRGYGKRGDGKRRGDGYCYEMLIGNDG